MALESATYINGLNIANPDGAVDLISTADDHLRLIKTTLKNTFPNITGAISVAQDDINSQTFLIDTSITANLITLTPNPAWTSYTTGKGLVFKAANTTTSSTVRIQVSGLSQISLISTDGTAGPQITAGGIYQIRYDGTYFQLVNVISSNLRPYTGIFNITPTSGTEVVFNNKVTNGKSTIKNLCADGTTVGFLTLSNQLLGINTSSPAATLEVKYTDSFSGSLLFDALNTTLANKYTFSQFITDTGTSIYNSNSLKPISFKTADGATSLVSIVENDGTTNSKFTVSTNKVSITGNNSVDILSTGSSSLITIGQVGNGSVTFPGSVSFSSALTFPDITYTGAFTGSTGIMNIGSGQLYKTALGNIGIGTTSPAYKLSVVGTGNFTGAVTIPTPASTDISTNVATTEYVNAVSTRPVITKVTKSGYNSILILAGGVVYEAHGNNGSLINYTSGNQINTTQNNIPGLNNLTPVYIPAVGTTIVDCGIYGNNAYALSAAGNLYTWGLNTSGQLGRGNTTAVYQMTGTNLAAVLTGVSAVYADDNSIGSALTPGATRLFVKKTDGTIWGCGDNTHGALGAGIAAGTDSPTFVQITGAGTNPLYVGNLGGVDGCLVIQKSDKTIWVAGYNASGQLGISGVTADQISLVNVTAAWNAGDNTMVIQRATGGFGFHDGTTANNASVLVMFLDNGTTSLIKTCGNAADGALGNNTTTPNITVPFTVPSATIGTRISQLETSGSGRLSVYVRNTSGQIWGWGYNSNGQLITGTANQINPTLIASGSSGQLFAVGSVNTLQYYPQFFYSDSASMYSMGYSAHGEGGAGQLIDSSYTRVLLPTAATASYGIKFIGSFSSAGSGNTIVAVTNNNTIYTWGYNAHNNITDGVTTSSSAPKIVTLPRIN